LNISSELQKLKEPIDVAITEFKKDTNVNQLIKTLSRKLALFTETLIATAIQQMLSKKKFLAELKAIGAKKALRFHDYRIVHVRILSGKPIPLRVPYFTKTRPKKRRRRRTNGHIALQWLGFIDRISMNLASKAAQAALLCPSLKIARQTLFQHDIELGIKTIQRIIRSIGKQAMNHRHCITLNQLDHVNARGVLVCIDGGRLRERKANRGRRPASPKRRGYHTDWREPTQIVIQCFNSDGSVCDEFLPIYDATMGDIDYVIDLIESYLVQLDITEAEHVIFCADGARKYWTRINALIKKMGLYAAFEVIDYTHAKQNLSLIVEKLPKTVDAKQKEKIARQWKDLLWKGDLYEIKLQIMQWIKTPKKRKAALTKFKEYFLDNFHRMQYAGFRYFNVTTGSGCVESAIRRVINLRLKSPGIFWKRETAELMLFLRSTLLCGRWNNMFTNLFADNRGEFQFIH
jgi:hypothetical protein